MSDTFIGIDLGTSGCRACLINADQQILQQAREAFPEPLIKDQSAEQDADIWWQAVKMVLAALSQHPAADNLKAIAIDGTSSTILACDENYRPVAPALMYNDSRATIEADQVKQIAPESASAVYGPSSSLSKVLWLTKHYPETKKVLHQADYIAGKLSGKYQSDFNNSLKLGFDPVTESWPEWITYFSFPLSILPEVSAPGRVIGTIKKKLSQEFSLPENVQLISGTTDSIAGFLATGANAIGDAAVSIGSTIAIKVLNDTPVFAPEEGIYSHKINNHWLVGGASNAGTTVLRQYFSNDQLQRLSEELNFDQPTGLSYYPLPKQGERFPKYNPALKPLLTPKPDDNVTFLQAILESLTRIEQECYQSLLNKGIRPIKRLFTIGGATSNKKWMDYRARQLQPASVTPLHTEACFGSALLAMQAYNQQKTKSNII